ncbi:MAG: protein TolQ [Kiloniellales bacterium]|nr:protein TolQ [Kiloniellales bacterium]
MENQAIDALALEGSVVTDLTIWGLFLQADIVVKVVIVVLILASFWSWAIIFDKALRLRRLKRRADQFEEAFWSGGSLDDLYDRIDKRPPDPMSAIFVSAMREWRRSTSRASARTGQTLLNLQQRIERVMDITLGREMQRLERQMIFLASVGSSAPFIGLFGTVWGIMNAFTSIAAAKNTTLAVVAPGIAEALFATALGLVAAIPAVIGFNKLSTDLGRYTGRLEAFAGEFTAILSRQLEEHEAA